VIDACTYKGLARVKIGPVQLVFNGEAKLHDVDPAAYTSCLSARGGDTKGRGSVQSEMRFALAPEAEQTRVRVSTDITLAGTVASTVAAGRFAVCNQLTASRAIRCADRGRAILHRLSRRNPYLRSDWCPGQEGDGQQPRNSRGSAGASAATRGLSRASGPTAECYSPLLRFQPGCCDDLAPLMSSRT
jgi:carbon monoxide dehydrogenase subunit G